MKSGILSIKAVITTDWIASTPRSTLIRVSCVVNFVDSPALDPSGHNANLRLSDSMKEANWLQKFFWV